MLYMRICDSEVQCMLYMRRWMMLYMCVLIILYVSAGRGCADVSVTVLDGSLTRTGVLSCGFVYMNIAFGGVLSDGSGALALGPADASAVGASAVLDLEVLSLLALLALLVQEDNY